MKKWKILRNKKGLDDDMTDALIAIVFTVIIFIFVFVFLSSNSKGAQNSAIEKTKNLENTYALLNYIRTPFKDNMNIGEYIGSLEKNQLRDECSFLVDETKTTLKGIEDWRAIIYVDGRETCSSKKGKGVNERGSDIMGETVRLIIPSFHDEINIIEFYFKLNIFGFSGLKSL
jgi:hypothetical protein